MVHEFPLPDREKRVLKKAYKQVVTQEKRTSRDGQYALLDASYKERKRLGKVSSNLETVAPYVEAKAEDLSEKLLRVVNSRGYDGRWGIFTLDREKQRGKDIAYKCTEVMYQQIFEKKWQQIPGQVNKTESLIAYSLLEAQHLVFTFCHEYGDAQIKSKKGAELILSAYLENILLVAKNINSGVNIHHDLRERSDYEDEADSPKGLAKEMKKIPKVIAPLLLTAVIDSLPDIQNYLDTFNGENSERLQKAVLKCKEMVADLSQNREEDAHSDAVQDYYFFLTSDLWWPNDLYGRTQASHTPSLDWKSYFSGINHDTDCGVMILQDKVVQAFSSDARSISVELAEGPEWNPIFGAESHFWRAWADLQVEERMLPTFEKSTQDDLMAILIESSRENWCKQDLEKAWDECKSYTELWVDNPRAFAIWLPQKWQEGLDSFMNGLGRRSAIMSLMLSRPDLPIIEVGSKRIVSRSEVVSLLS